MRKPVKRILIVSASVIALLLLLCCGFFVKFYTETRKMSPVETQQVIDGIYAVQDTIVNMFLVKNGNTYIAIDAGNNVENIQQGLNALEIDSQSVVAVFLTHTDRDHIAALELFNQATIYLADAEEQMINGQTARFIFSKNHLKFAYTLLEDEHIIDISGLRVRGILTPGHTPGSMCYLINNTYLFAGDSMSLIDGEVKEFNTLFNMDSETQRISLKKLAKLSGVQYIFTAHYGISDNFQQAFSPWKD